MNVVDEVIDILDGVKGLQKTGMDHHDLVDEALRSSVIALASRLDEVDSRIEQCERDQ